MSNTRDAVAKIHAALEAFLARDREYREGNGHWSIRLKAEKALVDAISAIAAPGAEAAAQTRSQKLAAAGITRRPSWRALPSDGEDVPAAQPEAPTDDEQCAVDFFALNPSRAILAFQAIAKVDAALARAQPEAPVRLSEVWDAMTKQPEAPAVPAGFKLVPVEPTNAMAHAGISARGANTMDVWRAMLAATPTAPAVAVPLLTDEQIDRALDNYQPGSKYPFARAVEAAVRAACGITTKEQP